MKLIIDIDEELYEAYKGKPPMLGDAGMDMIAQAIANGTPYEERPQGDLISREALLKRVDEERKYLLARGQTGAEHILVHNFRELVEDALTVDADEIYKKGYHAGFFATHGEPERPQSKWIITAEDSEGIHRIQCPFCGYEKGSDFIDYIIVTFEKFPPFCESCGAELRGKEDDKI